MYPARAITTTGTYVKGTIATFIITTIRAVNEPTGFTSPQIKITTADQVTTVLSSTSMENAPEGYYFFDWEVPTTLTAGDYIVTFSSDLGDQTFEKSQLICIIENPGVLNQNLLNSNIENHLMVGLYYMVKQVQEIPVVNEMAKISSNGLLARFTFPRWIEMSARTTVYRNDEIIDSGFTINHDEGTITFSSALNESDRVHADYNFAWFSGEEFATFLNLALQDINLTPPGTNFSLANSPDKYYPAIIYGAAINVYRRMIHDLSFQQPRIVFGFPEGYSESVDNFKILKENYEEHFKDIRERAKRDQWPAVGMIVAPEFTMPGGRSRWFRYLFKG